MNLQILPQLSTIILLLVSVSVTSGSHKDKPGKHHKEKGFHQQVHLSLGNDATEMIVTWATLEFAEGSTVEYGRTSSHLGVKVKASQTEFHRNATLYTHRALLTDLLPDTVYYYRVGRPEEEFSDVYSFRTMKTGSAWNPKLLVYGDLGYKNDVSLKFLREEYQKYDAIFHIGDFAYDLHDDLGEKGNKFMNEIQPVAAQIPYMTCTGNHEKHDNFTHYDARFSMLGDRHAPQVTLPVEARLNNHYYSVDIGPAHIVVFSTEFYYYYTHYGSDQIRYQFEWLKKDLEAANRKRDQTPWIIAMGHRPFYTIKECPQPECDANNYERPAIRQGISLDNQAGSELLYGLEKLFYEQGVDIYMAGHEHLYGRLLPVYNFTLKAGRDSRNPYEDAEGTISIITGSAGNKEDHPKDRKPGSASLPWVAHRHNDFGYTRLNFLSDKHISVEQTSDDQNGKVLDKFDIIKSAAKPRWMR